MLKKIFRVLFIMSCFLIIYCTFSLIPNQEDCAQRAYALEQKDDALYAYKKNILGAKGKDNNPINHGAIDLNNSTVSLNNINYINNGNYFKQNPYHFENLGEDVKGGTCTTVAMQLLLGYHNYYSDRRLIPSSGGDNRIFLDSTYGDFSDDPEFYSAPTPGKGSLSIGTTDDLYEEIKSRTAFSTIPGIGQAMPFVNNGVKSFINAYASDISNNVSINFGSFSATDAQSEINSGRPIVLGFNPITSDGSFHVIVAYGYASYNGNLGFICHYGWNDMYPHIWVPASWFGYQTRMSVSHYHNFTYSDYNDLYKVGTCSCSGHCRLLKRIFTTDTTGKKITGLNMNISGAMNIPADLYGNTAEEIEDEAFINRFNITSVTIASTVLVLGESAFENCTSLTSVSIPSSIITFRKNVFSRCSALKNVYLQSGLTIIGESAFYSCSSLTSISLPSSLTTIEEGAFTFSGIKNITLPASITEVKGGTFSASELEKISFNGSITSIYHGAFGLCAYLENIKLPFSVSYIGEMAFAISTIKSICLSNPSLVVADNAFTACAKLSIYTSHANANSWSGTWNKSNRPVFWGCTFSSDKSYVDSFVKSASNPSNMGASNGISDPYRDGYTFDGWHTEADPNTLYASADLASAPNVKLIAKWTKKQSCVAEGTLITLADGTQVAVEDLTGDENLLVWNMLTGEYDSATILFIDSDPSMTYEIIELTFSDGTEVKVIDEHAFFDMTLGEYVFLRNDAAQYIGHYFNKQGANGAWESVQLVSVDVYDEITTAWSPVTYGHLCYYVNGMLSMPGATEGFINIFDVDTTLMQYDAAQMEADIQTYGLYTYEEFNAVIPLPELVFDAFCGQYLKVSVGKGLITLQEIAALLERYSVFFE